jgi:hypothetical protein
MVVLRMSTEIPESRRLVLDLPEETPVGRAEVEIHVVRPGDVYEFRVPEIDVGLLLQYRDPATDEWRRVERSGVVREVRNRP